MPTAGQGAAFARRRYCPRTAAAICTTSPRPLSLPLRHKRKQMELLIGVGIFAAIWVVVIWGSSYINKNIQ